MIAEFMLQRTRADQVVPVYLDFLKKYPDIESLANSKIDDVKNLLKPLGLYWRSAHFKKAAQYIIKEHGGKVPSTKNELLKNPGVGDYVAGAILAVSFKKSIAIVDSNIARVINRYYGLELQGEIRRKKKIVDISSRLFEHHNPDMLLFALIDFSAIVCTPSNPKHDTCPLSKTCKYVLSN
jgi:A/G-specific adenine glycosylase